MLEAKNPVVPHAIRRAKERYNLDLTLDDLHAMIRLINEGKSVLSAVSDNGSRHLVEYQGRVLVVIYSAQGNAILTVLPACRRKPKLKHRSRKVRDRSPFQTDEETVMNGNLHRVYDHYMRPLSPV